MSRLRLDEGFEPPRTAAAAGSGAGLSAPRGGNIPPGFEPRNKVLERVKKSW